MTDSERSAAFHAEIDAADAALLLAVSTITKSPGLTRVMAIRLQDALDVHTRAYQRAGNDGEDINLDD
jgi:hypothetical protein